MTDWRFITAFVAIYCALYLGYSAIPDSFLRDDLYFYGIVRPSEAAINWMVPAEHVVGLENRLQSANSALDVVRGCDGSGVVFLLVAAVIAYRARFIPTLFGIAGAIVLVYVLNEMRIVTLYFVGAHRSAWFLPMHVYFIPTLMILLSAIYFAIWTAHRPHGRQLSPEA